MKQSTCYQHTDAWSFDRWTPSQEQPGTVESGVAYVQPIDGSNSITRERYATLRVEQDKIYEV